MRPKLFVQVCSLEARTRMSYRVDFWINTLFGFAAQIGLHFFVAMALFAESGADEIRGFAQADLIIYFVTVLLIQKMVMGPDQGGQVSEDIYEGGLTRYLMFPAPYLPFKFAENLGALLPLVLQAILFGVLAAFVLEPSDSIGITPLTVLGAVICTLNAALLYFMMRFPLMLVAFWQDNVWSLSVMLRFSSRLLGGAMVPLAFFPGWAQESLAWLPFAFLFDLPTRTLLGQVPLAEWVTGVLLTLGWVGVFAGIGSLVWRRGDLRYTGVGI